MSDTLDERQTRFVMKARIGRLASLLRDGSPHIAPVWYFYRDGQFLLLTEDGSQKHRNVVRDPRVAFCIDDDRTPYHTVLVRGRASVEPAPERAFELEMAMHYLGEAEGRRYIDSNQNDNSILIRITPERVSGW